MDRLRVPQGAVILLVLLALGCGGDYAATPKPQTHHVKIYCEEPIYVRLGDTVVIHLGEDHTQVWEWQCNTPHILTNTTGDYRSNKFTFIAHEKGFTVAHFRKPNAGCYRERAYKIWVKRCKDSHCCWAT